MWALVKANELRNGVKVRQARRPFGTREFQPREEIWTAKVSAKTGRITLTRPDIVTGKMIRQPCGSWTDVYINTLYPLPIPEQPKVVPAGTRLEYANGTWREITTTGPPQYAQAITAMPLIVDVNGPIEVRENSIIYGPVREPVAPVASIPTSYAEEDGEYDPFGPE